ncbi:hypothetical protein J2S17_004321 [Cytobacillus purgationiresistens]|uniref:Uncharacterized protein n=2 Tax=Cytobacillus purgationiresistens TaxID=863449 RepID=A0ABU0AMD9_9BACI|nr:hypothetical protein [Cytobacillus purgationiresistens]
MGKRTNLLHQGLLPHTIIKIVRKLIHFEKRGVLSMKQLMNSLKKAGLEKERTAVLRLEMDYELATLFEAMTINNEDAVKTTKQKLERIRQELLKLKAL